MYEYYVIMNIMNISNYEYFLKINKNNLYITSSALLIIREFKLKI